MGTHAGENILNCRVCGERFAWTLCLDAHIRTHRRQASYRVFPSYDVDSAVTMACEVEPPCSSQTRLCSAVQFALCMCSVQWDAYCVDHDFYNVVSGKIIWEHTLERNYWTARCVVQDFTNLSPWCSYSNTLWSKASYMVAQPYFCRYKILCNVPKMSKCRSC